MTVLHRPSSRTRPSLPIRTRAAVAVGNAAARGSRAAGLGRGGIIGGRVSLALQPAALAHLCRERVVVLVTGTNGKSTTTCMLAAALQPFGEVACNASGANMPDGLVAALAASPAARYAALEVDENHLPAVLSEVTPAAVVLLNLSRDQLDRTGEVRRTENVLRAALASCPSTMVIANCDDPLAASAAMAAANPVWLSAGNAWRGDSASCPRCGSAVREALGGWRCFCGFARPAPAWVLDDDGELVHRNGLRIRLAPALPGRANAGNLAFAAVAAGSLGVPLGAAAAAAGTVDQVDGRYRVVGYQQHRVRLLLAKNPAGWAETLRILAPGTDPAVLAVNAREADGTDPSWLWDVAFDALRGRQIVASGNRAMDLSVRLSYAEVGHLVVPDPLAAVATLPRGPVELVGNYTAFRDATARLADDR
ncbi:MurT ligase domain-containing protein [Amycolatopsis ultiminotia]|uniref:Lipid II isoglutaminyl synthase (glutamine-hydrolyzing) subunit MurT n=1 Tax=Amycolatopsis ultiminotia TaxID=543629 RepID=A0ABP6WIB7_9PSEU